MTGIDPQVSQESDIDMVAVGLVRRPTGIKGAVLVEVYSGNVDRFSIGDQVEIGGSKYEISQTGRSGKTAKLTFQSIDSIEKADTLRGAELLVPANELPENPPGVYYHYELMGASVVTTQGEQLGQLTEILETGSNDVFVVTGESQPGNKKPSEVLIPVIDGVIVELDKSSNTLRVDPPDGIL